MKEEIMSLLKELKEPIIDFLTESQKVNFLDYLPHLISALALVTSMVVVVIQYKQSVTLHQKAEIYNTKKDAMLEALSFLDTYISWLDMDSGSVPVREKIDEIALAVKARAVHSKLCISCDNADIIRLFVDIVVPNKNPNEGFFVFEKYNEFRNACRQELGYKAIDLPDDKIYLSVVSTRALHEDTRHKTK